MNGNSAESFLLASSCRLSQREIEDCLKMARV